MQEKVPEIVLTGGPCAGKTTALAYLQEKLQDKGIRTFVSPESATIIIGSVPDFGRIAREEPEKYLKIQKQIILLQLDLRCRFNELAALFPGEKRAIISDRGIMDSAAYMTEESFMAVLNECGIGLDYARDGYDAVIHLVTAAEGAEKFYTLANNPARQEKDPAAARAADQRTLNAWIGHSHLKIIDNSTGFEQKIKRALAAVCRALGIPVPLEIERKFLLGDIPDLNAIKLKVQTIFIEQIYLASEPNSDKTARIRRRSQGDYSVYYKTIKSDILSPGSDPTAFRTANVRQETESIISAADYINLKAFQDPRTMVIRKHRQCFVFNNQYFELDMFLEPVHLCGLCLLEIELTEENDHLELPPFLGIKREVTNDRSFTNYHLALRPEFRN